MINFNQELGLIKTKRLLAVRWNDDVFQIGEKDAIRANNLSLDDASVAADGNNQSRILINPNAITGSQI